MVVQHTDMGNQMLPLIVKSRSAPISVSCAHQLHAGNIVLYAPPGARLPDGRQTSTGKLLSIADMNPGDPSYAQNDAPFDANSYNEKPLVGTELSEISTAFNMRAKKSMTAFDTTKDDGYSDGCDIYGRFTLRLCSQRSRPAAEQREYGECIHAVVLPAVESVINASSTESANEHAARLLDQAAQANLEAAGTWSTPTVASQHHLQQSKSPKAALWSSVAIANVAEIALKKAVVDAQKLRADLEKLEAFLEFDTVQLADLQTLVTEVVVLHLMTGLTANGEVAQIACKALGVTNETQQLKLARTLTSQYGIVSQQAHAISRAIARPISVGAASEKRQPAYAVIIGVQYSNATNSPSLKLTTSWQDTDTMQRLLVSRFAVDPSNIRVRRDDGSATPPTKENILKDIDWLVQCSQTQNARVFFHFSGHGTQQIDTDGDEADGKDECILSSDEQLISDDILHQQLAAQLSAHCSALILLDCCHSGSGMDLQYHFDVDNGTSTEENSESLAGASVQMISGCTDDKTSAGIRTNSGPSGGAMTISFHDTIMNANSSNVSSLPCIVDIVREMKRLLKTQGITQRPQISASREISETQPLFAAPEKSELQGGSNPILRVSNSTNVLRAAYLEVFAMKKANLTTDIDLEYLERCVAESALLPKDANGQYSQQSASNFGRAMVPGLFKTRLYEAYGNVWNMPSQREEVVEFVNALGVTHDLNISYQTVRKRLQVLMQSRDLSIPVYRGLIAAVLTDTFGSDIPYNIWSTHENQRTNIRFRRRTERKMCDDITKTLLLMDVLTIANLCVSPWWSYHFCTWSSRNSSRPLVSCQWKTMSCCWSVCSCRRASKLENKAAGRRAEDLMISRSGEGKFDKVYGTSRSEQTFGLRSGDCVKLSEEARLQYEQRNSRLLSPWSTGPGAENIGYVEQVLSQPDGGQLCRVRISRKKAKAGKQAGTNQNNSEIESVNRYWYPSSNLVKRQIMGGQEHEPLVLDVPMSSTEILCVLSLLCKNDQV
jgi:hypothetical protein